MSGKKVVEVILLVLSALLAAGKAINDSAEADEDDD